MRRRFRWVISKNLHRRHLTTSQEAMVAQATVPFYEEEAKERQRESAYQTNAKLGRSYTETVPPNSGEPSRGENGLPTRERL